MRKKPDTSSNACESFRIIGLFYRILGRIRCYNNNNVCTVPIMTDNDILEFVQSSKHIMDADSDHENEINNSFPVSTSSEMRNTPKSIRSYLGAHSNGEMNTEKSGI
ncbi:hypothetical protein TNCV_4925921 [Trichonephila clavipes]|nr:hypothetical protein TNCV_4925921 [Trichonephila clavipes]